MEESKRVFEEVCEQILVIVSAMYANLNNYARLRCW